jgi:hypothetical protein
MIIISSVDEKDIKVSTTTGALGTQADITIFSLVRNNPESKLGLLEHYRISMYPSRAQRRN